MRRTLFAIAKTRFFVVLTASFLLLGAIQADAQIFHRKKKTQQQAEDQNGESAAPDKVLYNKAMEDIRKGRQEIGRLSLQTLINTYPDSEYLAKAKLGMADSFYKEGGAANMTQAINAYKDFGIFFPFLKEAAYAQLQVAMCHYKQMSKPDRDSSQARDAEAEFQTFLQKYPNDPEAPKAEQHLREVQELLAEGDYRVGYFYYLKGDERAAAARFISLTKRYPLYSKSDEALWMLGQIFEKNEHRDVASVYYSRIVKNYPMSETAADAKQKLVDFKVPVPQPDPNALAWMQAEQSIDRPGNSLFHRALGVFRSSPDLQMAARTGEPNLEPESDTVSATDVLSGGGQSTIGGGSSSAPGNTAVIETVTPGSGASGGSSTPTESQPAPQQGVTPSTGPHGGGDGSTEGSSVPTDPAPAPAANGAQPNAASTQATDAAKKSDLQPDPKKKQESSSKKKKGIKKIIPW